MAPSGVFSLGGDAGVVVAAGELEVLVVVVEEVLDVGDDVDSKLKLSGGKATIPKLSEASAASNVVQMPVVGWPS